MAILTYKFETRWVPGSMSTGEDFDLRMQSKLQVRSWVGFNSLHGYDRRRVVAPPDPNLTYYHP